DGENCGDRYRGIKGIAALFKYFHTGPGGQWMGSGNSDLRRLSCRDR
ncbi:MAG: hypothetical protein HW411_1214, partial [Gammaproteobacteria bacterium]|nr:hypothetical protein [Gammaproteobacteria bacterium]